MAISGSSQHDFDADLPAFTSELSVGCFGEKVSYFEMECEPNKVTKNIAILILANNILDLPDILKVDLKALLPFCHTQLGVRPQIYKTTHYANKDKYNKIIKTFFDVEARSHLIFYSGHGEALHDSKLQPTLNWGNWKMAEKEYFSLMDLYALWENRPQTNSKSSLFLCMDSCYSGRWVKEAAEKKLKLCIQASVDMVSPAPDGFFTDRWVELMSGKKSYQEIKYQLTALQLYSRAYDGVNMVDFITSKNPIPQVLKKTLFRKVEKIGDPLIRYHMLWNGKSVPNGSIKGSEDAKLRENKDECKASSEDLFLRAQSLENSKHFLSDFKSDKNAVETLGLFKAVEHKKNPPIDHYDHLAVTYSNNLEQAMELYKLSADLGHIRAKTALGRLLFKKNFFNEAFNYFYEASAANDREALHMLGICYRDGLGVEKNQRAAKLFLKLTRNIKNQITFYREPSEARDDRGEQQTPPLVRKPTL